MNVRERLSIKECENFISFFYSKIEKQGLMSILSEYQRISNNTINLAISSLYQNLINGLSFQDSIKKMNIKFPLCIEEILINSIENSTLDYALNDINQIFNNDYTEDELFDYMSRLIDEYRDNTKTDIICKNCFLLDFEKFLKRVETEQSYEVIFEQDGEKYFIQKYIGLKVIRYIEPSHSKLYKTFLLRFNELSQNKQSLNLLNKNILIQKFEENKFCLLYDDLSIIIIFK
jgi:hypothetical protein